MILTLPILHLLVYMLIVRSDKAPNCTIIRDKAGLVGASRSLNALFSQSVEDLLVVFSPVVNLC